MRSDFPKAGELPNETSKLMEEAFQRMIAEVEDYAIILLDEAGNVVSWNKGAELVKGYSMDEIVGKNYAVFYPQEDKDSHLPEKLLTLARKNGKAHHEGWRIRKDGSGFWGSVSITAVHDEKGKVIRFLKVTRNLTERKISENNNNKHSTEIKQKNEALKVSEDRYHKIIAEVQDYAIILLDTEGNILDWNKGAERIKGYTSEEIIGKNFRLFYRQEDRDANLPEKLLKEAVKNGSVTREGWRIRKDGSLFWGSVAITALHDDNGNNIGFLKVTRDLTDKRNNEDRLRNFTERLQRKNEELRLAQQEHQKMISEVQDYAIILLDKDGNIKNWNTGAEYIKGYSAKEIIGKNFNEFYTKEDREKKLPEQLLEEARDAGKVAHEGWRVRKDGSRFWGSVVITALHDQHGNVMGFSKVTRDLTEKKKADDALRSSAEQLNIKNRTLEKLNAELSSFNYVASHDLQEPLRKIQTFATRLREKEELSGNGEEYLEKIKTGAAQMQNLIAALLSYSQVSNDTSTFERIDLNEVVQTVKGDLEIAIQEKKAVIQSADLPVILGVPHQLHQLFQNLLANALKFSKTDQPSIIKINTRVVKTSDVPGLISTSNRTCHQISVSDNGIGFDPEFSNKIFEVFQRLHPKNTFGGTGIGLAIVKRIMENHHGVVFAEGESNGGATFNLYFPITDT